MCTFFISSTLPWHQICLKGRELRLALQNSGHPRTMNALNHTDSYAENIVFSLLRPEPRPSSPPVASRQTDLRLNSRFVLTVAASLALVALSISIYLAWIGLTSSKVVGCDGGVFDCSHVLTSRWSVVAGIPVSIPAVGLYVGVLASLLYVRSTNFAKRVLAWNALTVLSIAAALTAIWFISLQLFSIGKLCPYCLTVHGCGIALAALVIRQSRFEFKRVGQLALTSAAMVGGLIMMQAFSEPPETFVIESAKPAAAPGSSEAVEPSELFDPPDFDPPDEVAPLDSSSAITLNPFLSLLGVVMVPQQPATKAADAETKPRRTVPVNNGGKRLDIAKWPLWGNPEANNVVVEMFDYTCSHCRNTHLAIRDAARQLGGDLAVVALPVPLNAACNDTVTATNPERADACEVARIAIALWMVDRTKFTTFHDWLFEQSRSAAQARQHAATLVDPAALTQALAQTTPAKYIELNVQLYKEAGSGTIPKISFPNTTIVGEVGSGTTLVGMVRQYLRQH